MCFAVVDIFNFVDRVFHFCGVSIWDRDCKVGINSLDSCYSVPHMGHNERFSGQAFLKGAPVLVGEKTTVALLSQ